MTLLDDIIDGASGDDPVPSLLRKLKIVASRTGTGRLAEWVNHELEGYPDDVDSPPYRGPFDTVVLGHFVGAFGAEMRNAPIPPLTFPEEMRDTGLFKLSITKPLSEVQNWALQESINLAWSPDVVQAYNMMIKQGTVRRVAREDMVLVTASRPVMAGVFIGILDAVRTRILDLALELEKVLPSAGQRNATPEEKGEVARVVNNHFYGSSNVAINSQDVVQTVQLPAPGDSDGLIRYLGAAGLPLDDVLQLREDLAADLTEAEREGVANRWTRARAWFAKAGTDVGTSAVGGALTAASTSFFGG